MPTETFELKKEHIQLLSAAAFYKQESCSMTPCMDSKRPYGNSSWHKDAAKALGLFSDEKLGPDQIALIEELHEGLTPALQIICQLSTFQPGFYENTVDSFKCPVWKFMGTPEPVERISSLSGQPADELSMKYLYHLHTWGGFYNSEHAEKHGEKEGDFYFSTSEERARYLKGLQKTERKLGAHYLMHTFSEGYCWDVRTKLHRVVEYNGKRYYSERDMGVNFPYDRAKYHLENKWTPGFNSYPLGENFTDYVNLTTVQEWITGAFTKETP